MDRLYRAFRADAGSDLAGVQTRAVRDGDDWVLTGTKRWAGFALAADFIEVLARTREPRRASRARPGSSRFWSSRSRARFPKA